MHRESGPILPPGSARRAITLTEVLIAIGVLVLLLAFLLPALGGVQTRGRMAVAGSHLREVSIALGTYAADTRDIILPSQFNNHGDRFIGHPRCLPGLDEWHARGTWADILWTRHEMGFFPEARITLGNDYRNDSPDHALYEFVGVMPNPLRSPAANSRDVRRGTLATPFGTGAQEQGWPGYFAANNFFNDDEASPTYNGSFTMGQIRVPERSLYLVDSFAGEVIEDDPPPWQDADCPNLEPTMEVDFRYVEACLMLMLDGHVEPQTPWHDLDELENDRRVRVRNLTGR